RRCSVKSASAPARRSMRCERFIASGKPRATPAPIAILGCRTRSHRPRSKSTHSKPRSSLRSKHRLPARPSSRTARGSKSTAPRSRNSCSKCCKRSAVRMPRSARRGSAITIHRISVRFSCNRGVCRSAAAPTRSSAALSRCARSACRGPAAVAMRKLKDTDRHITDGITELLESAGGLPRVRRLQAGTQSFDREAWSKLAEHGWLGAAVPEAQGGTSLTTREIALLLEYAGKKLMPEPLVPALAASVMLARSGTAGAALLADLIAGKKIVMPVEAEDGLSAPTAYASDAHAADVFLALIDDRLVAIPRETTGVTVETQDTVDGGSITRLKFTGLAIRNLSVLASGELAREAFAAGRDLALLGYSALLVG